MEVKRDLTVVAVGKSNEISDMVTLCLALALALSLALALTDDMAVGVLWQWASQITESLHAENV